MTRKIFKSTVTAAAIILVCGIALVMAALYQYFGKEINGELKKEASYLASGVEAEGTEYLKQIHDSDARITYIAQDGKNFRRLRRMVADMLTESRIRCLKKQCTMQ